MYLTYPSLVYICDGEKMSITTQDQVLSLLCRFLIPFTTCTSFYHLVPVVFIFKFKMNYLEGESV